MSELSKTELETQRITLSISKQNWLFIKKLKHRYECDSFDATVSKLLEKEDFLTR